MSVHLYEDHMTSAMMEIMHEIETGTPRNCVCSPEDVPIDEVADAVSAVAVGFADEPDDDSWPPVKPMEGTPVAADDEVIVVRVVAPFSDVTVETMVEDGDRAVVVPEFAALDAKPMRLPSMSKTE